ncbi:MAG: hypothetical protein ACYC96_12060 [Fimbriimonadaceae bacterium]
MRRPSYSKSTEWCDSHPFAFALIYLAVMILGAAIDVVWSQRTWHGALQSDIRDATSFCLAIYVGGMVGTHVARVHRRHMRAIWGSGQERLHANQGSKQPD